MRRSELFCYIRRIVLISDMFMKTVVLVLASCILLISGTAYSSLNIDRSRIVINEGVSSTSLIISNNHHTKPYLAQTWIEDEHGKRDNIPFVVIPPIQRIEANGKSKVRIQVLQGVKELPSNKESVYYFNMREIPPKNERSNTLTLAIQTRVKLFWRPKNLIISKMDDITPGLENVTLTMINGHFKIDNPTPYHLTFVGIRPSSKGENVTGFEPVMVSPEGSGVLSAPVSATGIKPVLIVVNDYGSKKFILFNCQEQKCITTAVINGGLR